MRRGRLAILVVAVVFASSRSWAHPSSRTEYRIEFATYLGGAAWDQAREIIVLPDGSLLLGGQTMSRDFPTTVNAFQTRYAGDDPTSNRPALVGGDCFLARFSPDGRELLASTYFGGSRQERSVYGMALDGEGNVVFTTATRSPDIPTTPGAFQRRYGGPPADWLVAKLSEDLERLLWATYIGGSDDDSPRGGLLLSEEDTVYIVGGTESRDFPTTPTALQRTLHGNRDAAIVALAADGSRLVFSTLLGGSDWEELMGAQLDNVGNLYVVGHTRSRDLPTTERGAQAQLNGRTDVFVAKLGRSGRRLRFMTYLGGNEREFAEHRPWLSADGSLWVTGVTASHDFPRAPHVAQPGLKGRTDGFLVRVGRRGRRIISSMFLGGSGGESWLMPTPDLDGHLIIVGQTTSRDFPVSRDAFQPRYGGGKSDGVVAVVDATASRVVYASYLGGSGEEIVRSIALDMDGNVYLVGSTTSDDFPISGEVFQPRRGGTVDAFLVKLSPGP